MPKYFLYARKSTDEDSGKQIHSIEDQIALVTEYCQKENLKIEQIFTESQTAKKPGRPVFNTMLDQLEEKEVTGIVSWHPDRLARNSVDGGRIIYLLDQGILQHLKFPTFWFENTTQGKFMLSLSFSQAKYYVDSLSENVIRGLNQKAKRGEFPGLAPMGYINDKNTHKIAVDPQTAPQFKQALTSYSKGGQSVDSLALRLRQEQVTLTNGQPMSSSAMHRILTNPFYCGAFMWRNELYPGIHPPLISKKVFDQNQQILKQSVYGKNARNVKNFVFKGLIKCVECGHPVTAETHIKKYKRSGAKQIFTYYRCTKADQVISCGQKYLNELDLIRQVNDYIDGFVWPPSLVNQALNIIAGLKQTELKKQLHRFNHAKDQIHELDRKINQLLDLHLKGILNDEELLVKKNELVAKKLSIRSQSGQNLGNPGSSFEPVEIVFKNLAVAKKIRDDDLNLLPKAQFLRMTASNLFLANKILKITREKPWARLTPRPTGRNLAGPAAYQNRLVKV